jgi:hypothetical protein
MRPVPVGRLLHRDPCAQEDILATARGDKLHTDRQARVGRHSRQSERGLPAQIERRGKGDQPGIGLRIGGQCPSHSSVGAA